MRIKYFSLIIVLTVLFLGHKHLIAQQNNVFESKFKAYGELLDLGNQINTIQEKMNQEVKLIPSTRRSGLKKKATVAMKEMSFDIRPARHYTLLIKQYGPPVPKRNAIPIFVSSNLGPIVSPIR